MQAVIFDLDGVLCHTDHYHYLAWKSIADEQGIPFTEADNHRLRGVSRMESLDILLEKASRPYTEAEKQALAQTKNERYRDYLTRLTPQDLAPGALETLKALRQSGLKLAIGSSSKNAGMILDRLGIRPWFNAVSDGNSITRSKPDPEVFLNAAQALGVPPAACMVVEDADAGIAAAHAAGMAAVGIGDASASSGADYSIERLSQLVEILKG